MDEERSFSSCILEAKSVQALMAAEDRPPRTGPRYLGGEKPGNVWAWADHLGIERVEQGLGRWAEVHQRALPGPHEALGREVIHQRFQRLPESEGVEKGDGLLVNSEHPPGHHLEGLVERAEAAWEHGERLGQVGDAGLAVVEGGHDLQAREALVRNLPVHQHLGEHAHHRPAFGQRSIGDRAHQARRGASVDDAEAALHRQLAQHPGRDQQARVHVGGGSAKDGEVHLQTLGRRAGAAQGSRQPARATTHQGPRRIPGGRRGGALFPAHAHRSGPGRRGARGIGLAPEARVARAGYAVVPGAARSLDLNVHLNNARYLSLMDLGRLDLFGRLGILRPAMSQAWRPMAGALAMRFREGLRPGQRFQLHSRIAGWDAKWIFVEQRFERGHRLHATGWVKKLFRGPQGNVATHALLAVTGRHVGPSPALSEGMARWNASLEPGVNGRASVAWTSAPVV